MGKPEITEWTGLYSESWKGAIVDESFSHPAKFSRALIRRIYEHLFEDGYLHAGDRVLDPFGGVALGALDAMRLGLHWTGIELEPRFVELGTRNIETWDRQFRNILPGWGSAWLYQGDSRYCAYLIPRMGPWSVDASICSPPFGAGETRDRQPVQAGTISDAITRAYTQDLQGETAGNLAHMPMPSQTMDAAIASPPFESSVGSDDPDKRGGLYRDPKRRNDTNLTATYGETAGQVGSLAADTFWTAARMIVAQVYDLLAPGAVSCWVVKDFVRSGRRVPFSRHWAQLCASVGFVWIHEHRAMVIEEHGTQLAMFGEDLEITTERKSFFRRLAERRGSPRIDWETVLCLQKPKGPTT